MYSSARKLPSSLILALATLVGSGAWMAPAQIILARGQDGSKGALCDVWITAVHESSKPAPDLSDKDLKVYEDDVERQIVRFAGGKSRPLTVGLLVDASMKHRWPFFRPTLTGSSKLLRPVVVDGGTAFVAAFGVRLAVGERSSDPWVLEDSVHRAATGWLGGSAALFDSIVTLCLDNKFPAGRRVLVVVSDGDDTARKSVQKDAIKAAEVSRTQVFFLTTLRDGDERAESSQIWMVDAWASAQHLASATGGKAYRVHTEAEVDNAFEEIAQMLASEYVVTYDTAGSGPHTLRVQCARRDLKILCQKDFPARRN